MNSWKKIQAEFESCAPETITVPALTLELSLFFERFFDPIDVRQRLALPTGYKTFLETIQSTQISQTIGGWDFCLYGPEGVLSNTKYSFEMFSTDAYVESAGLWIEIGAYNDKHTLYLCCDRTKSFFRQIYDGHDEHPWLNGVSSTDAKSIESFLQGLAKRK